MCPYNCTDIESARGGGSTIVLTKYKLSSHVVSVKLS